MFGSESDESCARRGTVDTLGLSPGWAMILCLFVLADRQEGMQHHCRRSPKRGGNDGARAKEPASLTALLRHISFVLLEVASGVSTAHEIKLGSTASKVPRRAASKGPKLS